MLKVLVERRIPWWRKKQESVSAHPFGSVVPVYEQLFIQVGRIMRFSRRRRRTRRRGTAVTELAVVLPVLTVLIFVPIEISTMIFVRQSLSVAAYESIRVVTRPGGSHQSALDRATQVLTERKVINGTVTYTPSNPEDAEDGDVVTVTVSAPCTSNATVPLWVFNGRNLTSQVSMIKE